jgi:hypothetical protein
MQQIGSLHWLFRSAFFFLAAVLCLSASYGSQVCINEDNMDTLALWDMYVHVPTGVCYGLSAALTLIRAQF